jgi:hypothetical protein
VRFEKIWIEQCRATRAIKRRFGAKSALDYLIGEKLASFADGANDHGRTGWWRVRERGQGADCGVPRDVLIRVGGPNAGHTVYEKPVPFTFHQLPSGARRNPAAQIVLGPGAVISVDRVIDEIAKCEVSKDRLAIDHRR